MGRRASGTVCRAVVGLVSIATLVIACLPERELSSYAAERAVGSDTVASAAAPPLVPSAADPLGVETDGPPLEPPSDAGPPQDVASTIERDATPPPALSCRADCDCERRADRDFMFCAATVSFADAEALCADAGGALVSIDDAVLNDWLTEQMQARSADDFWLSGTDAEDEGTWRWADGRVFYPAPADAGESFAPWDAQQPNDLNGEDCMRSVGGVWRDLSCTLELAYVCQG